MSKPTKPASPVRQLAMYVPAQLKAALERRSEIEQKTEKTIVTEALEAHLRGPANEDEGEDE